MNQTVKDIFMIIIGGFYFCHRRNYFAIPNRLSEGGVIGVTIVAHYLFDWSPGTVNFVLNTALVAVGYKLFEKTCDHLYDYCNHLFLILSAHYG